MFLILKSEKKIVGIRVKLFFIRNCKMPKKGGPPTSALKHLTAAVASFVHNFPTVSPLNCEILSPLVRGLQAYSNVLDLFFIFP